MRTATIFVMCTFLLGGVTNTNSGSAQETSRVGSTAAQDRNLLQAGSGRPVVVFENGLGGSWRTWKFVQEEVSQFVETFSYNRAGYKGTPRPAATRDASAVVSELRALLARRGLPPPYVLVGHSLGGLYMQYYARNFPTEVAGLVLVDSSHWDQSARMPQRGFSRIVGTVMNGLLVWGVASDEADAFEMTQREVRESPPLRTMPLTVLTAGQQGELWRGLQRELAAQLPGSKHTIAESSGHLIQQDQPQLVSAAVRDIVLQLREK